MRRLLIVTALAILTAGAVAGAALSAPDHQSHRLSPHAQRAQSDDAQLAKDIAIARQATTQYALSLKRAKLNGYRIITRMIPNMGFHFMNPGISGFDLRKPQILVYEHRGNVWQLGALEWVFPSVPAKPPLPGATYGAFPAACHYVDGTFVPAASQSLCAPTSPDTGAAFSFWHPDLVTLHFWVWYPNPAGIFIGVNPLLTPFNNG